MSDSSAKSAAAAKLLAAPCVQDYFHDAIFGAMRNQHVETSEAVGYYLGNLLAEFTRTPEPDSDFLGEPLVFMLQRAMNSPKGLRVQRLKRMGDISLYVSGFFSDALNRALVDVGYYAEMGGAAYVRVATGLSSRSDAGAFRSLFQELARKFSTFVEVLAEVSEHHGVNSNLGTLRLYEKWLQTGSDRLARQLADRGFFPMRSVNDELA